MCGRVALLVLVGGGCPWWRSSALPLGFRRQLTCFVKNSASPVGGPDGLAYTARLPLSSATLNYLASLIRGHLKRIGSRWRASRTWARRGHTPVIRVRGCSQRRFSIAALACHKPGNAHA